MRFNLAALGAGLGFAIAAASIAYEIVAWERLRTLQREDRRISRERATQSVTILKPLAGLEAELFENLCSFVDQRYPEFQVVFGVTDPSDPAIDVAERVIAQFPDADVSLAIGDRAAAGNPKIANLSAMIERAKYDVLAIADADMRVDETYLRTIAASFDDPRVGAVTCLYCAQPARNLASTLGAMYINEQFAPSVLVANLVEPLTYCFGSTMAVRRAVLDEIGGLAALSGHIGDDYLLGKLVTERGYRVELAPYVVRNIVYERDMRSLLQHELRWARTIRVQRPTGYASLFLTQPLLCATVGAALTWPSRVAAVLIGSAIVWRVMTARAARRAFGSIDAPAWAIPVRDALTAIVWIGGFFTRNVRWRERSYSVGQDGRVATSRQQMHQNWPSRRRT